MAVPARGIARKGGKKNRKYDRCRNSAQHKAYVAEGRCSRNKARKFARAHSTDGKVLTVPHGSARNARREPLHVAYAAAHPAA
jgi:hypothetical protein